MLCEKSTRAWVIPDWYEGGALDPVFWVRLTLPVNTISHSELAPSTIYQINVSEEHLELGSAYTPSARPASVTVDSEGRMWAALISSTSPLLCFQTKENELELDTAATSLANGAIQGL